MSYGMCVALFFHRLVLTHSSTLTWKIPYGEAWWAAVHGVAKSGIRLSNFTFTFHFHALEKEMATHCSVLAWRIPGTGEPGGLPSMGSHRVRHDWSDLEAAAAAAACILCCFLHSFCRECQNKFELFFVWFWSICLLNIACIKTVFNLVNKYNYTVSFKAKGPVIE